MLEVLLSPLPIRPNGPPLHFLHCRPPKSAAFSPVYCNLATSSESASNSKSAGFNCNLAISSESASNPESESITSFFHGYGFSSDQIEWILRYQRYYRPVNAKKNIKPKLDCLLTFGFSQSELIRIVRVFPIIVSYSLERRIIPSLNLLKTLLGSVERVRRAVTHCPELLRCDLEKCMIPNVELLRENGVLTTGIVFATMNMPRVMIGKRGKLASVIEKIKSLGFLPSSIYFLVALKAKFSLSQAVWDKRVAVYKSFGWSDEDFNLAFLRKPVCMLYSEQKIKRMMEFYVNKLGWDPLFLSEHPIFVGYSPEKRLIPRCAVLNVLVGRELLRGKKELHRVFWLLDRDFEAKFVQMYEKIAPEVVEIYERKGVGEDFTTLRLWLKRNNQMAVQARKSKLIESSHKTSCEENGTVQLLTGLK